MKLQRHQWRQSACGAIGIFLSMSPAKGHMHVSPEMHLPTPEHAWQGPFKHLSRQSGGR
jgi:hypothetical protein